MPQPKKHSKRWLSGLLLLMVATYLFLVLHQPFAAAQPTINYQGQTTTAQPDTLQWPGYGEAAIGAVGYGVLRTFNNQKPIPTASIAKIITALAVLQQRPLAVGQAGPLITITAADYQSYQKYVALDGSVVAVNIGEQLTESQALQAMLLPSANNIAETMARWAFGSIDAYNIYANQYVHSLGLKSVTITDPSGFLPTTVASAQDLTTIAILAMQQPVIASIVAQPSATIPVEGLIHNYNFLLGQDGNVGIKTGNNDQDPGAYLFAFHKAIGQQSILLVGAIMGGPDLLTVQRDALKLVNSAVGRLQETSFVRQGDTIATYSTGNGMIVKAVAADDLRLVVWNGHAFTTTTSLQTIKGPLPAGTNVGTVTVTDTTRHTHNTVAVILASPLPDQSMYQRLTHFW